MGAHLEMCLQCCPSIVRGFTTVLSTLILTGTLRRHLWCCRQSAFLPLLRRRYCYRSQLVCCSRAPQITLVIVSRFNFENMLKSIKRYNAQHLSYVSTSVASLSA